MVGFQFEIYPSKIKGKERPRYRRVGNFVSTYTPKGTKSFEDEIRTQFLEQCGEDVKNLKHCEIGIELSIGIKMPKSWSMKKKELLRGMGHTSKPDIDNIEKAIFDALNGVAYDDDRQIAFHSSYKHWEDENYIRGSIYYVK